MVLCRERDGDFLAGLYGMFLAASGYHVYGIDGHGLAHDVWLVVVLVVAGEKRLHERQSVGVNDRVTVVGYFHVCVVNVYVSFGVCGVSVENLRDEQPLVTVAHFQPHIGVLVTSLLYIDGWHVCFHHSLHLPDIFFNHGFWQFLLVVVHIDDIFHLALHLDVVRALLYGQLARILIAFFCEDADGILLLRFHVGQDGLTVHEVRILGLRRHVKGESMAYNLP